MASTFTPNLNLEEPARGDDVGTWDTPVNNNTSVIDLVGGGTATIALNNAPIVLSAAQFQCANITFVSTLTGSILITFPSSFKKHYTILNQCTGSSAFTIQLQCPAPGDLICCPPGVPFDIVSDGTNVRFKNYGPPVGGYWDYAGSSVPNWCSGGRPNPFLNCDGSTFPSSAYPALAALIGTTLPDLRGRVRGCLNQGTGRITSSAGVDGNTLFAAGGGMTNLSSLHLPQLADPGHTHGYTESNNVNTLVGGGAADSVNTGVFNANTASAPTGITYGSSSQIPVPMPPMAMGGITLIRSA